MADNPRKLIIALLLRANSYSSASSCVDYDSSGKIGKHSVLVRWEYIKRFRESVSNYCVGKINHKPNPHLGPYIEDGPEKRVRAP